MNRPWLRILVALVALVALAVLAAPAAARCPACSCLYCTAQPPSSPCDACPLGVPPWICTITCGEALSMFGCTTPLPDTAVSGLTSMAAPPFAAPDLVVLRAVPDPAAQ